MNTQQETVFLAASGVTHDALTLTIAATTLTLAMLWVVWLLFQTFQAWKETDVDAFDFLWLVVRASIVLLVLTIYIR